MTIKQLVAMAVSLGAGRVRPWSPEERALAEDLPQVPAPQARQFREDILAGGDPLGDQFCAVRPPAERRSLGATFTPRIIIESMVRWASRRAKPRRVIDPGAGSGRFLLHAGRAFPQAELIGVEIDPVPAILARANLAVAGVAKRAQVILGDFREVALERRARTLWIGNPPYVRHHGIEAHWKQWLSEEAARFGLRASQLAGLHVHFYLRTAQLAEEGDWGTFITASEWLAVNYGKLLRRLLLDRLGLEELVLLEPGAMPFRDATTTGLITRFGVGSRPSTIWLRRAVSAADLNEPNTSVPVRRDRLATEGAWSPFFAKTRKKGPSMVELGEICRVHRGQVTGANAFWLEGVHSMHLPQNVLFRCITKAVELFRAAPVLTSSAELRRVIDIPPDLEVFQGEQRRAIDRFLEEARSLGVDCGYIASHRSPWWSVRLRDPAPILMTYMARRPPVFVRNLARARHINIAHGIYPRTKTSPKALDRLAAYLSKTADAGQGRTYAGGLTKFEPREVERILVPEDLCHD